MKNNLIQYVSTSLINVGLPLFHDTNIVNIWRLITIYILILTVDISTAMVSVSNYNNFNVFAKPVPFIAAATISLGSMYVIYNHRKSISEMLQQLGDNLYTYPDEHLLRDIEYEWFLREENVLMIARASKIGNGLFLAIMCLPIIGELLYYHRIKTFIYPCWTPWKIQSLPTELLTFVIQFSQCAGGVCFNHVMTIFVFIVVVEFVKQYRRLTAAVLSIETRSTVSTSQHSRVEKGKPYDQLISENIKHCVLHHQMICKCFINFRIWFSAFFSIELAICLMTFAFALYVMMNASNLSEILNSLVILSFIWINLLIRCIISEIFTSLNDRLAQTLFSEINWYEANKPNRRLLLIFHQLSSRSLRLYGLCIFEATRNTFGKLIRITYSIFNVLLNF